MEPRFAYITLDSILLPVELDPNTHLPTAITLIDDVLPYYFHRIAEEHPDWDTTSPEAWGSALSRIFLAVEPIVIFDETTEISTDLDLPITPSPSYPGFFN